ncbi:MAG: helix-turn-helix domain-containing protein [Burkholderiaceae bacterium]|nr:helix-turn-helix domain-containing protein [Burkholderiaceae bacterium]
MSSIVLENLAFTRKNCVATIKSCGHSLHMSIHRRIKERRLALGMTSHQALADRIGVSWQTVQLWEKEGGTAPNRSRIEKVAKELGVTPAWLLNGDPEPMTPFDKNVTPSSMSRRAIPVISAIQAGLAREITEPYVPGDGYATIYADDEYSKWAFGLDIEGDSMLPEFQPGDRVIIEPEWIPRPGEYVAAKNGRQEATFKKYRQRGIDSNGNDVFELVPLNPDYPTVRSDETPLTIIGVMAEHRRKARRR